MDLPFIDVVVPTFNRAGMLERVIQSLAAQSYPLGSYRIIAVDDGSVDETWSVLQETAKRHSNLRVCRIAHAGSYAARNRGWQEGRGDIVAFTDDDCVADRDWLTAIAGAFTAHPEALGVQGKSVTLLHLVTPLTHQIVVHGPNTLYHTCNIAYRRKALLAVGGFDEEVTLYSGDSQMGAAVSALGPIVFSPKIVIIHPPRPRVFLGREEWIQRLSEAFRLYRRYPDFYRRNRGSHFLLVVTFRWLLGSTMKEVLVHLPWLLRDPILYVKFLVRLLRERANLTAVLPGFWREHRA